MPEGSYGVVTVDPVIRVAYKRFKSTEHSDAIREIFALRALPAHPWIVRMLDATASPLTISMPAATHGSLLDVLRVIKPTRLQQRRIAYRLLAAATHLHHHHIVHRDIKPGNILVYSVAEDICLADFGSSVIYYDGRCMTIGITTINYSAPEVLKAEVAGTYTQAVDFFSIGVILAEMYRINCSTPYTLLFSGKTNEDVLVAQQISSPHAVECSGRYAKSIRTLLSSDPIARRSRRCKNVSVGAPVGVNASQTVDAIWGSHPHVNVRMRTILHAWLKQMTNSFAYSSGVTPLAMHLVDAYVGDDHAGDIVLHNLQLYGCVMHLIAANIIETSVAPDSDYAYMSDHACTTSDIVETRARVLCRFARDFRMGAGVVELVVDS